MRTLVIDNLTKKRIQEVIDFAEKNVFTIDDLLDVQNGQEELIAGNNEGYVCNIPVGYRVVYSLEDQSSAGHGIVKHISISVDSPDKLPSVAAVEEIIKLFGFKNSIGGGEAIFKIESEYNAINVWELKN